MNFFQMEVFLQSETKDFVMLLFNTLDSKSYLKDTSVKQVCHNLRDAYAVTQWFSTKVERNPWVT